MPKPRRFWQVCLVAATLGLTVAGCNMDGGGSDGQPTVSILSPGPRSVVRVDEPLEVQIMAEDPGGPGVVRLDVQLDGLVKDTFEAAGPQLSLGASMEVTPSEPGASILSVIAYREDGTASMPVTIALDVAAEAVAQEDASQEDEAMDEAETAASEAPSTEESLVLARANNAIDLLERPGVGCRVIGQVPRDEVIELLRRTSSTTNHYYQTNFLGTDNLGWVFSDPLNLLADDGDLPRDPEATCLICGDGTCSSGAGETCATCSTDCGTCVASAPQPPAPVSQPQVTAGACPAGQGGCCGDGVCQSDESGSWCGDCPEGQVATTGGAGGGTVSGGDGGGEPASPQCGNNIVEAGESCDPPESPPDLVICNEEYSYCSDSCSLKLGFHYCGPECGNDVCEAGESEQSCPDDCADVL